MKHLWKLSIGIIGVIALLVVIVMRVPVLAVHTTTPNTTPSDISTLLGSNAHTGYNPTETAINPTTAPNLRSLWSAQAAGHITDQPLSVNGVLYWGSWDGLVHATASTTGHDLWATNVGTKPGSCAQSFGVVGSGTVATVPVNGVATSVLYIAGGQDNLDALNTSTGKIIWQTNLGNTPAEFVYPSTTVYNGSVYIGTGSFGDCPVVQGQIFQVNASTGQIQHTFNAAPTGCIGVGIWGTISVDEAAGKLYLGTGNSFNGSCKGNEPLGQSIVELNASDLSMVASWPVPATDATADDDYGSTPTLFQATINGVSHAMVGMVNKNGYYYALDRNNIAAGALWKARISVGGTDPYSQASIPTSAYDGTTLYAAGGLTTIQGKQCPGSLQALDPNTGAAKWQLCLGASVVAPTVAVPGLVVVGSGNTLNVVSSATGKILFSYHDTAANAYFEGAATISNGVLYAGSRSGKLFAFGLQSAPAVSGPISSTWYFAEGKVGQGFTEFLTLSNPNPAASCTVNLQYLLASGPPVTRTVVVPVARRWTEGVNTDLHIPSTSASSLSVSTIVTVPPGSACKGVVAERPMYFVNFAGISSGTDVLGSTHTATSFSFADLSTAVGSTPFITILNPPGGTAATITATYLAGGAALGHQTLVVQPGTRGTIAPTHFGKGVAALVTSTRPVVVEQPVYFNHISEGNAGLVSGAASVIGAQKLSTDWLFAEGYTGTGFQEHLVLANPGNQATTGSLLLEYDNGTTATFPLTLGAMSQNTFDVNQLSANPTAAGGTCNQTPCTTSNNVSAEIKTKGAIVAERELFFHYTVQGAPTVGGSMLIGQMGPPAARSYSFAEGYTYTGYSEWLTLQNPTAAAESITVTLFNAEGRSYSEAFTVNARSRYTLNINSLVSEHLLVAGDGNQGYEVSMSVGAGQPFVAERPMYWNAFSTQGGSTILGYTGG